MSIFKKKKKEEKKLERKVESEKESKRYAKGLKYDNQNKKLAKDAFFIYFLLSILPTFFCARKRDKKV